MKLKPVNDKIVVKPMKKEDDHITEGGIILPDTAQNGVLIEGTVIAASDGMYSATGTMIPLVVSEGDTILYNKNAQKTEHRIDGEEYILMSVNEVMSIVKDN
jgi:co-chaperonin GroES (HSP10)|tara:strand:- start:136 stop:441 length:306 start_codon:yes stop_codon:yes gene_type:complete